MIISWEGGQNFTVKTKNATVKLGNQVKLGELVIDMPGEYEVGGVQLEHYDGVFALYAEGLTVGHIKKGRSYSQEELERLNAIDILLLGIGGEEFTDKKLAKEVITQIDPSIVIPMFETDIEEFAKEEGATRPGKSELKITKTELPEDERQVVILDAHR